MTTHAAIDPAVLFIGVIAISIINAIVKAARAKSENAGEQAPDSVRPKRAGETEQERMRKFMEALGMPSDEPERIEPVMEVERPVPPPAPVIAPKPTGRRFTPPIGPAPSFPREAMTRLPRESAPVRERRHPWIPIEDEKYLPLPGEQEFPREAMTRLPPPERPSLVAAAAQLDEATARLAKKFSASTQRSAAGIKSGPMQSAGSMTSPAALIPHLRDPAELRKAIILREIIGPCRGLQSLP